MTGIITLLLVQTAELALIIRLIRKGGGTGGEPGDKTGDRRELSFLKALQDILDYSAETAMHSGEDR